MNIEPLETTYSSTKFRSRQEARWAIFLDELDVAWCYEYEGYAVADGICYLPDFWLPKMLMWLEVKGDLDAFDDGAQEKALRLAHGTLCPVIAVGTLEDRAIYIGDGFCDDWRGFFAENWGTTEEVSKGLSRAKSARFY